MLPTYEDARAWRNALDDECGRVSAKLANYPRGAMGLTPDSVKASPEYREDKRAFDSTFAALRRFNTWFLKAFRKEWLADRRH